MRPMLEIEWLDGRLTRLPEPAGPAGAVAAEVDVRFDDLSDGLWLELRSHEQRADAVGGEAPGAAGGADPRGAGCTLYAEAYWQVLRAQDMPLVRCVYYEGAPRLQRIGDELVCLTRVAALHEELYGGAVAQGALLCIAECARGLFPGCAALDPGQIESVAGTLGVSEGTVRRALAWQADYAAMHEKYAASWGICDVSRASGGKGGQEVSDGAPEQVNELPAPAAEPADWS